MAPDRVTRWLQEAGVAFEVPGHAPVRTREEAGRVRLCANEHVATVCRFSVPA